MTSSTPFPFELVAYSRRADYPGLEACTLRFSAHPWRRYSRGYEFFAPTSGHARVWHRRRVGLIEPGGVLCAHPGEVFAAQQVLVHGSARSLTLDASLMARCLSAHGISSERVRLRGMGTASSVLLRSLLRVWKDLQGAPTARVIEGSVADFVAALVEESIEERPAPSSRHGLDASIAERLRTYLHERPSSVVEFAHIAREAGVDRFRMLRAFKRRFGVPPQVYQLQLRVGLAQQALQKGARLADVATDCGFFDQSHLTRHFRRQLGITPAEYARAVAKPSPYTCAEHTLAQGALDPQLLE